MELLTRIRDWFGAQAAAPIGHATLGTLIYKDSCWKATPPATPVPVLIQADYRGPTDDVLSVAAKTVEALSSLDTSARAYLRSAFEKDPLAPLTLAAVVITVPDPGWVKKGLPRQDPNLARALLGGAPMVALQYAIEGDHNVLDALFVGGAPLAWEYH